MVAGAGLSEGCRNRGLGLSAFMQVRGCPLQLALQVGDNLNINELCYVEKLWTDRIRVFKACITES